MQRFFFFSACFLFLIASNAFEVMPRVFPADTEVVIDIKGSSPKEKRILAQQNLYYLNSHRAWSDGDNRLKRDLWEKLTPERGDGVLRIKIFLKGEGQHFLRLSPQSTGSRFNKNCHNDGSVTDFYLYTLKPELFQYRPFKGDFHMHSTLCGHAFTEPEKIPAYCREVGFDYMALSEHKRLDASHRAIASIAKMNVDIESFTAEEMHTAPDNMLHSVSLGHSECVSQWARQNPKELEARMQKIFDSGIFKKYPDMTEYEKRMAAMSLVYIQYAREKGAKLIQYCHPADQNADNNYNDPVPRYRQFMLENAPYDTLEMPNGASRCVHNGKHDRMAAISITNAWGYELVRQGKEFCFTSVSDCHNHHSTARSVGKYYNIIYSKKCDLDALVDAMKNKRLIATAHLSDGLFMAGPSQLIDLSQFMEAEYFPTHDRLCKEQSVLLLKFLDGNETLHAKIREYDQAIRDYRENFYYKGNPTNALPPLNLSALHLKPAGCLMQLTDLSEITTQRGSATAIENGFKTTTPHTILLSKPSEKIPYDTKKKYRFSVEARVLDDSPKEATICAGFSGYTPQGKPINSSSVNRLRLPLATLAAEAAANATTVELTIAKGDWEKHANMNAMYLAFDAKADNKDLPNFNTFAISPKSAKPLPNGNLQLTLSKPLTKAFKAGTSVALHTAGKSYMYTEYSKTRLTKEWQTLSGTTQMWPGLGYLGAVVISGDVPMEFRNIQITEIIP